jgi:hypothetical protein
VPRPRSIRIAFRYLSARWEVFFFLVVFSLLYLQVILFVAETESIASLNGWFARLFAFQNFTADRMSYVATPIFIASLLFLLACPKATQWSRRLSDILGISIVFRMMVQLLGLNVLVFDFTTPRYLLITQLLCFLPYSLLVWGWIYWRLDSIARTRDRPLFRFDFESETPRPIDYFVAVFSSVFSPTIVPIKGNSARARILVLAHGFVIYNLMGLTFSRAVALVQGR